MIKPIEGEPRPNGTNEEFSVTNPDGYIIQIEEIGVTQINPIIGNIWNKSDQILWSSDVALSIDVAPGKFTKIPNVNLPKPGTFNYNYLLLKNTIQMKANAKFASGSAPDGWFTTNNPIYGNAGSANSGDYNFYTETLNNFGDGGFSPYINLNPEFNVQGLLLKSDKITTATNPSEVEYILAVFDAANPLVITENSKLSIKFKSSNRVIVYPTDGPPGPDGIAPEGTWADSAVPAGFSSLPFVFEVVSS